MNNMESKYKERAIKIIDSKLKDNLKLFDIRYISIKDNPDVLKADLNKDILEAMCQLAEEAEIEQYHIAHRNILKENKIYHTSVSIDTKKINNESELYKERYKKALDELVSNVDGFCDIIMHKEMCINAGLFQEDRIIKALKIAAGID